jgi:tRNA(Ile)-lysidine synthase
LDRLHHGLKTCGLENQCILLAVSGGADSVAMLRGMLWFRDTMKLNLHAAHLNHNLRGDKSLKDVAWLQALCKKLEIPLIVGSEDVASIAESRAQGTEEAARQARYAFLEQTAEKQHCSRVAVAHTAGDQAETILHHVLRGTGISGLRGMPRCRSLSNGIFLVRPMLDICRPDIESYLFQLNQDFRRDETNLDETFTRNRIRNSLLPLLTRDYNLQVSDALRRLGQQATEVQETLEYVAGNLLMQAVEDKNETTCRLNCDLLSDQPRHLIRECFTLLWRELQWPRQRMGFAEWDHLAGLVLNGGTLTFPGNIQARRRGKLLVLTVR